MTAAAPVVVDLFAGPGGWDTGVRDLGLAPYGIEWDDAACATARAAGHHRLQADIAQLDPRATAAQWGPVRGLIASPPCQGFSAAGKGKGRADSALLLAAIPEMLRRDVRPELHDRMTDDRSVLVLEPLRWALAATPSWLTWEQVPAVLPIWDACANVLRSVGYSVATGVVNAEQYGVPQTRRRAILVARAPWATKLLGPATLPTPTHSRYYTRDPKRLDAGVLPWVSMAQALGWGMTARPAMTVTGGGTGTGGAEPFGNAARKGIAKERDAGRWLMCSAGATAPQTAGQVPRDPFAAPSATITGKGTAAWVRETPAAQVKCMGAGMVERHGDRPPREPDDPSFTITGAQGGGSVRYRWSDGTRVTVEEAAILQSFPAGYPWQGNKGDRYRQVGDAVPPLLARAVVAEVAGLSVRSDAEAAA